MKITVRPACPNDLEFLAKFDRHVPREKMEKLVSDGFVLTAMCGKSFAGWLRYGFFWDEIPFMNMLFVLEDYRGNGVGTALVREWEKLAAAKGHGTVMTSTQANEMSQHFYRKLGYRDMGGFTPFGEEYEIIMGKRLER
ncbi:MAG: GNAT family N-acetyltransferase [Oscillospiraceae bacterium]|nr:GNAT family N-acetyltransferase [Oscillospiraceae bacterium]